MLTVQPLAIKKRHTAPKAMNTRQKTPIRIKAAKAENVIGASYCVCGVNVFACGKRWLIGSKRLHKNMLHKPSRNRELMANISQQHIRLLSRSLRCRIKRHKSRMFSFHNCHPMIRSMIVSSSFISEKSTVTVPRPLRPLRMLTFRPSALRRRSSMAARWMSSTGSASSATPAGD